MQHEIDDIDKRILNILQQDATLPLKNIAEQVRASVATCQRRIQFMMDTGVITRQVAIINPRELGYQLTAFVLVTLSKRSPSVTDTFVKLMGQQPNVVSCYETSGEFDFVLLVHAKHMQDFHHFTSHVLNDENQVKQLKSQFVMNFSQVGSHLELT